MQKKEYKSGRKLDNLLARFVRLDKSPLSESTKINNVTDDTADNDTENAIIVTRQTTINSDTDNILELFSEQPVNIVCDNSSFKNIDFDVYLKCFVHELRTPLSIISLGMNILEKNCKKSQKGTINDVYDIIKYIENIFTNFAVIQDGNIALNVFEPFNILHLIKNIHSILNYNMLKHNITFEYNICDKIYPWIYGDVHNIQHVLINIINNAIKYSIPSRTNKIILNVLILDSKTHSRCAEAKDPTESVVEGFHPSDKKNESSQEIPVNKKQHILFSICDTNDYILPHIKQHLFESFNSTSGSGLGLYICKQIIEMHGGTISHDYITVTSNILEPIKSDTQSEKLPSEEPKNHEKQRNRVYDEIGRSINERDLNILVNNFHKNIGNKFEFLLEVDICEDVKLQANSQFFMADNISSINNKSENSSNSPSSAHNTNIAVMKYQNSNITELQKKIETQFSSQTQNVIVRRKSFTQIEENQDFSNISKDKLRYNIMIVDDSILNRKMLYKLLKQIPIIHEVFTAVDGIDAINKICKNMNSIDFILIDKYMPQMDGVMVTKLLRGINYDKLIFEITGMDCKHDKTETFDKFSANYVFIKPFDKQKMNQMIQFIQKNGVMIQPNKIISLVNNELIWTDT